MYRRGKRRGNIPHVLYKSNDRAVDGGLSKDSTMLTTEREENNIKMRISGN